MNSIRMAEHAEQPEAAEKHFRSLADLGGPKPWPVVGNALQIRPDRFHQQMEQWSRDFGNYYRLRIGRQDYLIVADHHATTKALRDRPDGFNRTQRLTEVMTGMRVKIGLFAAEGEVWRKQRRMVMAAFDPTHVKAYFPTMSRVTNRLEARWKKSLGTDIDLTAELMRFTVDTITGLAFGHDVNTLESGDDIIQQHLDKLFPKLFSRVLSPFQVWRYIRFPSDRALDRSMDAINTAINGFVSQSRQRIASQPELRENPSNLLEAMINSADQGDSGLNDDDVAGNVLTMLLAGEDTTANSIAWLLALLWENPETLQKLQHEVRGIFDGQHDYSMEKLAALDYLDACINESMRLKPVAPFLALQAIRDTSIGDVLVPTGTHVFTLMRKASVDDQYLPEAAKFIPGRWMDHGAGVQSINSVKRISMPFGAGPRICPGRYLALLEMKIAMTMLLTRFDIVDISTPNRRSPQEQMAFTMVPVGLRMRLQSRK